MIWTIPEIVAFLDTHRITVSVHKGQPMLIPHEATRRDKLKQVAEQVKARRSELLEHFENMGAVSEVWTRAQLLDGLTKRAAASIPVKAVYVLCETGLAVDLYARQSKDVRKLVRSARYACVESDREWTRLPPASAAEAASDD